MPIPLFRRDGWLPTGHHAADWDEVLLRFSDRPNSRHARLAAELMHLRDALNAIGVMGTILLDGSYISEKPEPGDFDILMIGPANIQVRKDAELNLASLLDASSAEARGYSLFFTAENSPVRELLSTLWNLSKEGTPKCIVEITL